VGAPAFRPVNKNQPGVGLQPGILFFPFLSLRLGAPAFRPVNKNHPLRGFSPLFSPAVG